ADMAEMMGERNVVVIRELTKLHEEVFRGTVSLVLDALEHSTIAGEYVIILEGRPEKGELHMDDALREVRELMRKGLGRKESAKKIGEAYGFSKKELYDRSLEG
ncbi:MAG: 16S rRNA (cytidine(1402)-2'-O)-methyltransferase, partial [Nitrospirota bacterium]|nr:16S rRNA (cytidine(1402)-2'-O)-methyltransferase [Nitrospirota bacterium]